MLYLYIESAKVVYLLFVYPKNVKDNISSSEKKVIHKLMTELKRNHEE